VASGWRIERKVAWQTSRRGPGPTRKEGRFASFSVPLRVERSSEHTEFLSVISNTSNVSDTGEYTSQTATVAFELATGEESVNDRALEGKPETQATHQHRARVSAKAFSSSWSESNSVADLAVDRRKKRI